MRKIIFIITLLLVAACFAQEVPEQYLNKAKEWSEVKLYDQALRTIEKGLKEFPLDHDLLAYEIRVLLWQKNFEEAELKIQSLLTDYPNDHEGFQLLVTSYWWQNKWSQLEKTSKEAQIIYPDDPFFQEKELIALLEQKEYKKANTRFSNMDKTSALSEQLSLDSKLHYHQRAGLEFSYSKFNNTFSPWAVARASYHREAKHSFNVGFSQGFMFDQAGVSYDASYYPSLSKTFRGVLDISGSNSEIFPQYRFGAELIADVRKLELRLGSRMISFKSSESEVFIHTAGIGVYKGDFYVNYKAYLAQLEDSNDITHTFLIRRNFSNRYHFVQLNLSRGTTPLQVSNFSEISRLEASSMRASYHVMLWDKFLANVAIGYQQEQYVSGNRNRMDGSVGLSMIF